MKLVITEKPSVAKSIAKVIGADKRGEGFLEGNGFLVSWCIGHLVELSPPEVYDEKLVRWRYEDLPILPKWWQYQVQMATKKQFDVIEKLIHRNDVQSLICATDAGREGEKNILEMVLRRMVCAAGKPYRFEEVSVTVTCAGEEYLAKGKTVLERGWRSFEKNVSDGRDKKIQIPKLKEGQSLMLEKVSVTEGKTEAPKHYTESSLLLAMESAGKKETTEFHGIGTPATRAGILEKLVQKGYLERRGEGKVKQLLPTKKGNSLIEVVPEQLRSAVVTVEWEKGLNRIEQKMDSAEVFMQELEEMVSLMVFRYEFQRENPFRATVEERIGACPCCSNDVVEREKGWFCVNGGCHFALWKNQALFQSIGKPLNASIVKELLERKETALKNCESKRTGKRFDTVIRLAVQKNGTAGFEMDFGRGRKWQGKLFKQKISCIRD